jgi:hypothetical protein
VTTRTDFAADEWNLVVQLPRWVVAAASAAQQDGPMRTVHEIEAGYVETARAAQSANAFVAEVAAETMKIFDSRAVVDAVDFHDQPAGISTVLDRAAAVVLLLAQKADPVDAKAYRQWLVSITDVVITAARSGVFGPRVTDAEQAFRERLVQALQR